MFAVLTDKIVYDWLGFATESKAGGMLHFFIYDSVKIFFLLFFMISIIGFLRSFVSAAKVKSWVARKGVLGHFFAAGLGALLPFCSCSTIPLYLSFVKIGVPLGVTFSFLITSPIINEYLVVLMVGYFGWKITLMYVASGLLIGITAGLLMGRMRLEKYIVGDMLNQPQNEETNQEFHGFKSRVRFGLSEAISIVQKIWIWILVGVGAGAVIHNYIPQEAIQSIIEKTGVWGVPLAVLLGVPMYGSCAAIVPVAVVLFEKGLPLGTALAFMMAVSALSLPEAVILRRAMKLKLIFIFFGITTVAIIFTGYLFNLISF